MRAGSLRHVITLQRQTETVSPTGAALSAWTNVATVRAEIVKQSASEFLTGFGEAESGTVIFRTRRIAADFTTADRIMHGGTEYDLKEIVEIERGRGLELRAVAVR